MNLKQKYEIFYDMLCKKLHSNIVVELNDNLPYCFLMTKKLTRFSKIITYENLAYSSPESYDFLTISKNSLNKYPMKTCIAKAVLKHLKNYDIVVNGDILNIVFPKGTTLEQILIEADLNGAA